MPIRLALFVVYLAYALASGSLAKHGSGLDPLGLAPSQDQTSQPPASDHGSGLDPIG
jgi:hypothetical protein